MNFTVTINKNKVITELVSNISITGDITSLFLEGKITINDISSLLYNDIKTGMSVVIKIFDDKKTYELNTKVIKFNKIPGKKNLLRNVIEIYVISDWFFDSDPMTTCHTNNVSGIIDNIIKYKYSNSFKNFSIEVSEDSSRVRYQLYESSLAFMNRILKYGRINNLPVYLYPTLNGNLVFNGIYNMMSTSPKYALVSPECNQINDLNGINNNYNIIYMNAYRMVSNVLDTNSRITTLISNDLYVPSSIKICRKVSLNSMEINNSQSADITSPKVIVAPWHQTPEDSYSIAIKNNFEANLQTYTAVAIIKSIMIDALDIGSLVRIKLPNITNDSRTNSKSSLGEGNYIIKKNTINITPNDQSMRLELIQASRK